MDVWMLGCISFVFSTMIELAIVCYITRCQGSCKKEQARESGKLVRNDSSNSIAALVAPPSPAHGSVMASHQCSQQTGLNLSGTGSIRLRPHVVNPYANTNGTCRPESARGSMIIRENFHQRKLSHGPLLSGVGAGGHCTVGGVTVPLLRSDKRNSSPPPPVNTLTAPLYGNGGFYECSPGTAAFQPQPLTFEQVNGHQASALAYCKSPSKRRHHIRIKPESIDKMSIVCFPLAFTIFNLIYWWYYLSQTFDQTARVPTTST